MILSELRFPLSMALLLLSCSPLWASAPPPNGLLSDLLGDHQYAVIYDAKPEFSWIVNSTQSDDMQTAYDIIVSSSLVNAEAGIGDMWAITTPTIRGAVTVSVQRATSSYDVTASIPANTSADIYIPTLGTKGMALEVDGAEVQGKVVGEFLLLENMGSGVRHITRAMD